MNIGYIRVSSKDQNLDRQEDQLKFCDTIFREKASGKNMDRPELRKMLEIIEQGDTVYITELSRLGRSVIDLHTIADEIVRKGGDLKSLKENIDLTSPVGMLTFNLLGSFAEFERQIIHERQAEGIAAAKKRGKFKRKYKVTSASLMVFEEHKSGNITMRQGAEYLNMSASTFCRRYKEFLDGQYT